MVKRRARIKDHRIFAKAVGAGNGLLCHWGGSNTYGEHSGGVIITDTLGNAQFDPAGWDSILLRGYSPWYRNGDWMICEPRTKVTPFVAIFYDGDIVGATLENIGFTLDDLIFVTPGSTRQAWRVRRYLDANGRARTEYDLDACVKETLLNVLKSEVIVPRQYYPEWMHGRGDFVLLQGDYTARFMLGEDFRNRFSVKGWEGCVSKKSAGCVNIKDIRRIENEWNKGLKGFTG